jgi:hypothetical protein
MMDKIASDAYSQGAYEALSQMNVPGHIKQAAAHLIKEAVDIDYKKTTDLIAQMERELLEMESALGEYSRQGNEFFSEANREKMIQDFKAQNPPPSPPHAPPAPPVAPPAPAAVEAEQKALGRFARMRQAVGGRIPTGLGGRAALGAGVLGAAGLGAYGMGAFDEDEGLSNAEMAALGLGGAGALVGGAYASGLL